MHPFFIVPIIYGDPTISQVFHSGNLNRINSVHPVCAQVESAMVDGYHNYLYWDTRGLVHASMRRCAFLITKGPDEKDGIIQNTERLLALIDQEENFQRSTRIQNQEQYLGQ